jgi:hypothetical protein
MSALTPSSPAVATSPQEDAHQDKISEKPSASSPTSPQDESKLVECKRLDLPPASARTTATNWQIAGTVWAGLSWLDRLLSLFIVIAMILGVVIGEFADVTPLNEGGGLKGVSAPLVVGLLVMMWPILTK